MTTLLAQNILLLVLLPLIGVRKNIYGYKALTGELPLTYNHYRANIKFVYLGSCRYQGLFPEHFPLRMHSTKEIIYYLNNVINIGSDIFEEYISCLYGDMFHLLIREKSLEFLRKKMLYLMVLIILLLKFHDCNSTS